MRKIPGVSLHWIGSKKSSIVSQPGQKLVDNTRAYHKNVKGWRDIGYHYIIHRDQHSAWNVYEGRLDSWTGAHSGTSYGNTFLGIMVAVGTDEKISENCLKVLAELIASLSKSYGFPLSVSAIKGHRDFIATECPGTLYPLIPKIVTLSRNSSPPAKIKQDGENPLPQDEQISKIMVNINGELVDGVRINSQGYIWAQHLKKLGINVDYDKDTDTVILSVGAK